MSKAAYLFISVISVLFIINGCAVTPQKANQPAPPVVVQKTTASESATQASTEFAPQVLYQLLVAEVAGQRGQLDVAVANYLAAAKESRDAAVAARAVRIAMFAQAYNEALEAAQLWVELAPDNANAHRMVAPLLLAFGHAPEALQHYQRFIKLSHAQSDHGFMQIASQLSREKNGIAALSIMDKLVGQNKDFPYAWLAQAQVAARLGKTELASQSIDHALELKSHWAAAVILKARILSLKGDKRDAIDFLKKERSGKLKNNMAVGLSYARLLTETNQLAKARQEFERLVKIEPDNIEALYAAGVLALQQKDYDTAESHLKGVLALGERVLEAHYYLGRLYEEKADLKKALQQYLDVRHGEFYLNAQARAASIMAELGNLDKAREHLHKIRVSNDQEQVKVYLVEGELLRKAKKYQEALDFLTSKLKKMPDDTSLLYARALIAEKVGNLKLTEKDLLAIIKREPSNAQALNALGFTLADRTHRYQEALKYIKRALAVQPGDAAIIDSMGWVQYRLGNREKAVEYLRRALSLISDPEIAAHLGEVLWEMGNKNDALSVWKKALKEHPDHKALIDVMKRFGQ
jgi:tetratricopeptide (TPR) repeat protein